MCKKKKRLNKSECFSFHQVFLHLQVGVAACQLARALGLRVLGTAGTSDGMKLALSNGAHLVFNHREEGYTNQIMVDSHTGATKDLSVSDRCRIIVFSRRPQRTEVWT